MSDLYSRNKGVNYFRIGNGEIFVNFNRKVRPFIRVNIYPNQTKTFNFTKRGYNTAIEFILKAVSSDDCKCH